MHAPACGDTHVLYKNKSTRSNRFVVQLTKALKQIQAATMLMPTIVFLFFKNYHYDFATEQ